MKKKITALFLALAMMATFAVPAFAASVEKDDPYGFIWEDEEEDIWVIQYYEYSRNDGYEITDYVTLDGTKLYDSKGKQITTIKKMTEADEPTVVFDEDGELYFLISNTSIGHMDKSTDTKYEKASISSASYITVDNDELGTKVGSKNLSSLNFSGSYSRNSNSSNSSSSNKKSGDYVLTYAYNGDYTKTAYDAYKDDELIMTVHTKGSNVWLKQGNELLSDTCVGAKFVGYSVNYSVILYDLDGTLYYFLYDEDEEELDYNRAHTISLGEEIMKFERDDDGFIIEITTDEDTYDLEDILEDEYDWDDDDDYDDEIYSNLTKVTNSTSKSSAYKNSKIVATIQKTNNYLYYEGEQLDNSYRPTYFGFTEDGYPVWINYYGELYYYNGSRAKLIDDDVTKLTYDSYGFAYRYYVSSKYYDLEDEI